MNSVPGWSRLGSSESLEGLDREARGTKLFHTGHVDVSRSPSSTGWGRALMVVVARTVKEAPDCEPQCGVGTGGVSSAFTPLVLSRERDAMMIVGFMMEHVCVLYAISRERAESMTRWIQDG